LASRFARANASVLQPGVDWLAVPFCRTVGGLLGGAFSRIVIVMARGFRIGAGRAIKSHPLAFAFVCGLGVALCGVASNDTVFGTGYAQVKAMLESGVPLPWNFGILKFAATALSTISGIPGGIFSPSLAVGAFVIVTEITENHNMVLPVMVASLIAYATSRLFCPEGIYHALAKGFLRGENGVV
jgi:H+/Cl- antiporter ClcA